MSTSTFWRLLAPGFRVVGLVTVTALVAAYLVVSGVSGGDAARAASKGAVTESAPDLVSALVAARAQGHRVEVLSERTSEDTVWVNADGTVTRDVASSPIRVRDEGAKGGWRDVDLTLAKDSSGVVSPEAAPVDVKLSGDGDGDLARLKLGSGQSVAVDLPMAGDVSAPTLDGGVATYAVTKNVDAQVSMTTTGFNTRFVVKSAPSEEDLSQLKLGLTTKKLDLSQAKSGALVADDADGKQVGGSAVFTAWDARKDAAGDPAEVVSVDGDLSAGVKKSGSVEHRLELTPDSELFGPDTVYPVTVDPDISSVTKSRDTWVQEGVTASKGGEYRLLVGADDGAHEARSYIQWKNEQLAGKDITKATMRVYQYWTTTCTARPTDVNALTSSFTSDKTKWSNRPSGSWVSGRSVTKTFNSGISGCGAGANFSFDITNMARGWADGSLNNNGVALMTPNAYRHDKSYHKRFCSVNPDSSQDNCNKASLIPILSITYNQAPKNFSTTPAITANSLNVDDSIYTSTLTPTFGVTVSDPDPGAKVKATFEVHSSKTVSSSSKVRECTSGDVASGSRATCSVGALPNNTELYVRARANDSRLNSAWSGWTTFRTAAGKPATPVITCPDPYRSGSWNDDAPASDVSCTVKVDGSGFSGASSFTVSVDGGNPTTTTVSGTATKQVTISKANGSHSISVVAKSRSGITSSSAYSFGYGYASLTQPDGGGKTTDKVRIKAVAPAPNSSSYQYRVDWRPADSRSSGKWNEGTFQTVQAGLPSAAAAINQFWSTKDAVTDNTVSPARTLNDRVPVLLELQVCFKYSTGVQQCTADESKPVTALRVPHAFGDRFPTSDAGPGQVALWTGEYNQDASDVSVPTPQGGLEISRSHSTFAGAQSDSANVFGPGWQASFDGNGAGASDLTVTDNTTIDGTIAFIDGEGSTLVYREPGQGRLSAPAGEYDPVDDDTAAAENDVTITGTGASRVLSVTDPDGTVTKWKVSGTGTPLQWVLVSVAEPGGQGTTTYTTDSAGRVTRILAAVPDGISGCPAGAMVSGCRALNITYAPQDTATSSQTGDIAGQVKQISFEAYNPDKTGGAGMDSIPVATYKYFANKRLASVTDPRDNRTTAYTYETDGEDVTRLATMTPAGQAKFSFQYTDDSDHKLVRVKRAATSSDTAEATLASFAYGVPTSGDGLPNLSSDSVTRWQQKTAPTYGAAVFGPDHPVNSSKASEVGSDNWKYADLQYTDASGYTVNTASYGKNKWLPTVTDYDDNGAPVREIAARDLDQFLTDLNDSASATLSADPYATITKYMDRQTDADGNETVAASSLVTDTWGPQTQNVTLASGDAAEGPVRTHTHTTFDQGAPNGGINAATGRKYGLATTVTTGVAQVTGDNPAQCTDIPEDLETTSKTISGYDPIDGADATSDKSGWTLGQATTSTKVVAGATDIVTKTKFDANGNAVQTREPGSDGNDEATTDTVYYTAGDNSARQACGSKPQWAGMACWSGAAAHTASGPDLPDTLTASYNMFLQPTKTVEKSDSVERTSITTYLADGATNTTATSVSGLASSTATPVTKNVYDAATGLQTATQTLDGNGTVTGSTKTSYDAWGRTVKYENSQGDVSTTSYVEPGKPGSGEVSTFKDAKGTSTYSYDGADANGDTDPRGVLTGLEQSGVGTFKAAYDNFGNVTAQTAPGGIITKLGYSPDGSETSRTILGQVTDPDTGDKSTGQWLSWSQQYTAAGQVSSQTSPVQSVADDAAPAKTTYKYDQDGRLTLVQDGASGACVTREYKFDERSDRTSLTTSQSDGDGNCSSSGGDTKSWTYDKSSRIKTANTGGTYGYDELGRVTRLPAGDAPKSGDGDAALKYFDTDEVQSIKQGEDESTFTLDPEGRRLGETDTTGTGVSTLVRHYSDDSDNPSWVAQTSGSNPGVTRYVASVLDGFGAQVDPDGKVSLAINDPQGSTVTTIDVPASGDAVAIGGWQQFDEYGNAESIAVATSTGPTNYGWQGRAERAVINSGLTLMGARVYNPVTGQFTSTDPVAGGNENAYTYPADPVNASDTTGECAWDACIGEGYVIWILIGMGVSALAAHSYAAHHRIRVSPWHIRRSIRKLKYRVIAWTAVAIAKGIVHFAHKKKARAKNAERKNPHRSTKNGGNTEKHTKVNGHGGGSRLPPNPNKRH